MQQAFLKRPNADDVNCVCSKIQLRCKCCTLTEVVCIQKHLCHDRSARSLSRTTSIFLIPSQSWPALLLNMGDTTALSHSMKPVRNAQDRSSLDQKLAPSSQTARQVMFTSGISRFGSLTPVLPKWSSLRTFSCIILSTFHSICSTTYTRSVRKVVLVSCQNPSL